MLDLCLLLFGQRLLLREKSQEGLVLLEAVSEVLPSILELLRSVQSGVHSSRVLGGLGVQPAISTLMPRHFADPAPHMFAFIDLQERVKNLYSQL